ncbi:MAG: hypothetical protein M1508_04870 [Nitrospirae bacterium]|nr:hypothetical protein [Nitrospirota bacterium]
MNGPLDGIKFLGELICPVLHEGYIDGVEEGAEFGLCAEDGLLIFGNIDPFIL